MYTPPIIDYKPLILSTLIIDHKLRMLRIAFWGVGRIDPEHVTKSIKAKTPETECMRREVFGSGRQHASHTPDLKGVASGVVPDSRL